MGHKTILLLAAAALLTLSAGAARAQESDADLRSEIEQLKLGQKQINQQLEEIKKLLAQQRQAPAAAAPARPNVENQVFDIGANPVKGASTAKLTLVEFTDYQ